MSLDFFYFPETSLRTPYFNLAIEEAIALNLNKFQITAGVRVWKNPKSIIIGLSEDPYRNIKSSIVDLSNLSLQNGLVGKKPDQNTCYVARRASGGGTVFHNETGNINYSFYFNYDVRKELYPVKDSYDILLGLVTKSLRKQGFLAEFSGKSDLTFIVNGTQKKISGNAQFRKKNCIVQHGTLILKEELIDQVTDVLHHPPEEPEYRKNRSHREFLTSLPKEFSLEIWKKDLVDVTRDYLGLRKTPDFSEFSFFSKGFSSFRKQVLLDSEIIRKKKYQNLNYILNREIPT